MKTMIVLAAAVTLSAGAALADDLMRVGPMAPQPINEVRAAKLGAVAGTVTAIGHRGLVIDDGTGSLWVRIRDLDTDEVKTGQQATVVGRFKHGGFRAMQLIREDGTIAASHARHQRGELRTEMRDDDD